MRIIHIAAGAGSMYCGACARDINLIRGLLARGHDVEVIPLYTPLRIEGDDALPVTRIFYSGINVFLQQALALFRITPAFLDRLFESQALLKWVSRFAIETRAEGLGPMTVSVLAGKDGRQRKELAKLLAYLEHSARPDVVTLTNSMLSGIAPEVQARLHVPVVCMLQGEDTFVEAMPEPHRSQARELMQRNACAIDLFISPGEAYAARMAAYLDVPAERIRVIRAGVDTAAFRREGTRPTAPFVIGYLSVITPSKGLDVLVDAFIYLAKVEQRDLQLHVAGKVLNEEYWQAQLRRIAEAQLLERFVYYDEVDLAGKIDFLHRCSAFAFPTRLPESRAMAALEALAAGLPLIAPDAGVLPEIVHQTDGGLLFPQGDARALAREIARLVDDPQLADALGRQGAAGVARDYAASRMAEETLALYERLVVLSEPRFT